MSFEFVCEFTCVSVNVCVHMCACAFVLVRIVSAKIGITFTLNDLQRGHFHSSKIP